MLAFKTNRADAQAINAHLYACDAQFIPHLSERVDLKAYVAKIEKQAVQFEAWDGDVLIGLVAGYANDPKKQNSFLTNVSVLPDWHGKGIAGRLLNDFVNHARGAGFDHVVLSVDTRNERALALYRKHGFIDGAEDGIILEMILNIRKV